MYAIIVYDLTSNRTVKMHKKCSKYLHWKQNSVFEGKISKSNYKTLKQWAESYVKNEETILIYTFRTKEAVNIDRLGQDKDTDTIL